MTDTAPEPLPQEGEQAGPRLDVQLEGSVTDGVFRIDLGAENMLLITMQYSETGSLLLDQAIAILNDKWTEVHESIIEAREAAVLAEAVKPPVEESAPAHTIVEAEPAPELSDYEKRLAEEMRQELVRRLAAGETFATPVLAEDGEDIHVDNGDGEINFHDDGEIVVQTQPGEGIDPA
jgi:hypothetical protein